MAASASGPLVPAGIWNVVRIRFLRLLAVLVASKSFPVRVVFAFAPPSHRIATGCSCGLARRGGWWHQHPRPKPHLEKSRHDFRAIVSLESQSARSRSEKRGNGDDHDQDYGEWLDAEAELLQNEESRVNKYMEDDEAAVDDDVLDWMPDSEKARILRERRIANTNALYKRQAEERQRKHEAHQQNDVNPEIMADTLGKGGKRSQHRRQEHDDDDMDEYDDDDDDDEDQSESYYTEEEEDLIRAMGGKTMGGKREEGYLGDSTLEEIASYYSIPVCYLADVLCMWGVPVPINIKDRLGDLVTGEQAFAILEAIHTLDTAALQERYSHYNLVNLCLFHEMNLKEAFEMAMKEGWSLPFGVNTFLRVEQEDELIRVLADDDYEIDEEEDYYD